MCWRSGVMTYLPWRVDELLMYRYRRTPYKEWLVKGKYEAWHHCRVSGLLEHVSGADGSQHSFFQFPSRVPVPRRSPPAFDDPQSSQPAASCVRRPRVVKDVVEVCSAAPSRLNPPHRVFDDMPTSASHRALKQDVTVFSLIMRTIRHLSWRLLSSTTLSRIIPARTMLDDPASSKPVGDYVRRLGVVEY